ncbi:MAG: DUF1338 domain-containing protein [Bacteroidota bacterium]
MDLKEIFDRLWIDYTALNPSTGKIFDLFAKEGETIVNDHIAFRTFDDPRVNIDVIARPFTERGYRPAGKYEFENKHLFAKHFELPEDSSAPRVFISQLKRADFSKTLQDIIKKTVDSIPRNLLNSESLIFSGGFVDNPEYSVYEALKQESEYAAWLYVFGFRANHFTISVNHLNKYDKLEKVNQFLKENGFILNTSGGEIKGTKEQLLRQSSTLADIVDVDFESGSYSIPACYYEFAQRYRDGNGKLFSGFIAKSADKIFESTDFRGKEGVKVRGKR